LQAKQAVKVQSIQVLPKILQSKQDGIFEIKSFNAVVHFMHCNVLHYKQPCPYI
jgi:hypothetical protein